MPQFQGDQEANVGLGYRMRQNNKPTIFLHCECRYGVLDLGSIVNRSSDRLNSKALRSSFD